MKITLPVPDCPLGYPRSQLEQILGDRFEAFQEWMRGQTMAICEASRYSPEADLYIPSACAGGGDPHGVVACPHDVARFISGKEPLD